jgi:hypothetical protein
MKKVLEDSQMRKVAIAPTLIDETSLDSLIMKDESLALIADTLMAVKRIYML